MIVTIPSVPQVRNCGFDTAEKLVVTGNIYLSCRPVHLNWLAVRAIRWSPEYITTSIIKCLLHLEATDFGLVALHPNVGCDLEFFV